MDRLLELAERVEAATGPDRELELAIWQVINPMDAAECRAENKVPLPWLHCYTASLDAAMTLVPKNTSWGCGVSGLEREHIWAWVDSPLLNLRHAATPALALTAAALRARALSNQGTDHAE